MRNLFFARPGSVILGNHPEFPAKPCIYKDLLLTLTLTRISCSFINL